MTARRTIQNAPQRPRVDKDGRFTPEWHELPPQPKTRRRGRPAGGWGASVSEHVEVRGFTMEPDPANPALMRQTAYCRFCAAHRPDEDPRWPCGTARLAWALQRSAEFGHYFALGVPAATPQHLPGPFNLCQAEPCAAARAVLAASEPDLPLGMEDL